MEPTYRAAYLFSLKYLTEALIGSSQLGEFPSYHEYIF